MGGRTKPIRYLLGLLALAVVGCGGDGGGSTGDAPGAPPAPAFALSRAAAPGTDPTDPANEVIVIDNTGTAQEAGDPLAAGSIHAATPPATLDELTGAFSVRYYLAAGKDCLAGSPRAHIRLDTDADGTVDVELWGAVGPNPTAGTSCPSETWTVQDFTDGVARWSASTGGGLRTWADLVAGVPAPYAILDLFLVEDAELYDPTPDTDPSDNTTPVGVTVGATYYDDFTVGTAVLADHADAGVAP